MIKKTFPIEEIRVLLENGSTIEEIAKQYSTSRPTMSSFLRENNLKTKKQKQLEKCQNLNSSEIKNLYEQGNTIKEIAEQLGVSTQAIKIRLKETNTYIRTNSEAHKKYHENETYFNTINTYDKAYLLGFICADGYVSKNNELGIHLSSKDQDMIYWFKEQMETDKPIFTRTIEGRESCGLIIQNEKITKVLNNYGIVPNKSLIIDISKVIQKANIKDELVPAFLLGYFDGDGGIYKSIGPNRTTVQYSCSITGTLETCNFFKKYFNDIGFMTKRHKDNKNNYTYQIGGRNKVKEGLSKLYSIKDKLSFFYKRKYEIYCEL